MQIERESFFTAMIHESNSVLKGETICHCLFHGYDKTILPFFFFFVFVCVCVCVCVNLFWKIYLRLCIINSNQSIKIWGVLIYLFISSQRVRWNYFKKIRFQGGKISRMSIAVPLPKGTGYAINNEVCKHVFSRFQKFTTN